MGVGSRALDRHIIKTDNENQLRSLESLLTKLLVEASEAHHVAVERGEDTDGNWAKWYGHHIAHKLAPVLTSIQAVPVCDAQLPSITDKVASDRQDILAGVEVSSASKLHVG